MECIFKILSTLVIITFFTPLRSVPPLKVLNKACDILDYSQPEAKFADLTWGLVGHASGFIEELRLHGSYKWKGPNRDYISDTSEHPLFQVIKILYPSPRGILNIYATDAANVNVYNKLTFRNLGKIISHYFLVNKEQSRSSLLLDLNIAPLGQNEALVQLLKNIEVITQSAKQKESTPLDKHERDVLAQVLLSYVYFKANTEADIDEFVEGLDKQFHRKPEVPLKENNYYNLAKKIREHCYNRMGQIGSSFFIGPNASGPVYKFDFSSQSFTSEIFEDTVENSIRNLLSVLAYGGTVGRLDFPSRYLRRHPNRDPKFIQKSEYFMKKWHEGGRDVESINNTSIEIRSDWCKVFSELPGVVYMIDGKQKIKPGLLNLCRVFAHLTGYKDALEEMKDKATFLRSVDKDNDKYDGKRRRFYGVLQHFTFVAALGGKEFFQDQCGYWRESLCSMSFEISKETQDEFYGSIGIEFRKECSYGLYIVVEEEGIKTLLEKIPPETYYLAPQDSIKLNEIEASATLLYHSSNLSNKLIDHCPIYYLYHKANPGYDSHSFASYWGIKKEIGNLWLKRILECNSNPKINALLPSQEVIKDLNQQLEKK